MLESVFKRLFWILPIGSKAKNFLAARRFVRILEREAREDARGEVSLTGDSEVIRDYADFMLSGYGRRSEQYQKYEVHEPLSGKPTLVAYYLTQYHPDPHNDLWWGKGTTEWNNVDQGTPQFVGHYQPRRPGELGYYDLRVDDVMRRQIELARNYGIGAFCFYYYWFNGTRLLDYPLNKFLADSSLDFPFFYCWANENWTKRFSGSDCDVLLAVDQRVESYEQFIDAVLDDLADPRYFRVDGRPVLSIYRPSMVPDTELVLSYWRARAREVLGCDLYIIASQERDTATDWVLRGYDAESEFQPMQVERECVEITKVVRPVREDYGGKVYDYADLVENRRYLNRSGWARKVYPAVMPMWDNTARRNHRGIVFFGSTPDLYCSWLEDIVERVMKRDDLEEKIVFLNAWNEWGEGAYLEPDRFFGYAYLEATWRALRSVVGGSRG